MPICQEIANSPPMQLLNINETILDIWYRAHLPPVTRQLLMPRTYTPLAKGGLLCVGMNPAFDASAFSRFLRGTNFAETDPKQLLGWKANRSDFDLATAIEVDRLAVQNYRKYYGPFHNLARSLKTPWQHVDLFLIRVSAQNELKRDLFQDPEGEWTADNLNEFARAQLDIFKRILQYVEPKMLVVANATASRMVDEIFHPCFDEEQGHHWIRIGHRYPVPYFPSAMWSGRNNRVDVYSLRRLNWQIHRAWSKRA